MLKQVKPTPPESCTPAASPIGGSNIGMVGRPDARMGVSEKARVGRTVGPIANGLFCLSLAQDRNHSGRRDPGICPAAKGPSE